MSLHENKKVTLDLSQLNGNAFALMAGFRTAARREGWTPNEIEAVLTECKSGDYDHLVQTLIRVTR